MTETEQEGSENPSTSFEESISFDQDGNYELWRVDDHGNKVKIGDFSQDEALRLKEEFEAKKHKQLYSVRPKDYCPE